MSRASFEERFLSLKDELPPAVEPPASIRYCYARRAGSLLFTSGHGPRWGQAFRYAGKIGSELTVEQGYAAARLTALNLMQTIRKAEGTLDRVRQFVDVLGAVNSAPGFTDQPRVMNGFSECIYEIFGDAGYHTRMAIAAPDLPYNIAVEIKIVVELEP